MQRTARILTSALRQRSLPLPAPRFASTAPPAAPLATAENTLEQIAQQASHEIDRSFLQRDVTAELDTWFPNSSAGSEPILLPVSTLASTTPTLPADSNVVIALPPDIFARPIRRDILHRCVVWYLSQLRTGTKMTKSRSTVNYSGRKVLPQKGTGKARAGDASSGVRRGGAPIHPIFPKNWAQALPRKIRELGLRIALSSKLKTGLLRVVQDLNEGGWKGTNEARRALSDGLIFPEAAESQVRSEEPSSTSKEVAAEEVVQEREGHVLEPALEVPEPITITRFGPTKNLSILFLYSPLKPMANLAEFVRVTRNIPGIEVLSTEEVQVYDVLKYRWLVMEGQAVDALSGEIFDEFDMEELEGLDVAEGVAEGVGSSKGEVAAA